MSEQRFSARLATRQDAMAAMLCQMVDIDFGSYIKLGIDAVGDVVRHFLAYQGIAFMPRGRAVTATACGRS